MKALIIWLTSCSKTPYQKPFDMLIYSAFLTPGLSTFPQGLLAVPRDHHLGSLPWPHRKFSAPASSSEGDWDQENDFSQEAWCPQQPWLRSGSWKTTSVWLAGIHHRQASSQLAVSLKQAHKSDPGWQGDGGAWSTISSFGSHRSPPQSTVFCLLWPWLFTTFMVTWAYIYPTLQISFQK